MFPSLRTHSDNFTAFVDGPPILKDQAHVKNIEQFMVGREESYRQVQNVLDGFMKGRETKGFVSIRGSFGIGKTLFIRKILNRLQDKINSNQYSHWKYGEKGYILVSGVGPITKTLWMCGLRSPLRDIFKLLAQRMKAQTNDQLLS